MYRIYNYVLLHCIFVIGFGTLDGEMWLGNENIHRITNQDAYILHVVLVDWEGHRAYAEYEGFRVHSNVDYYSLR